MLAGPTCVCRASKFSLIIATAYKCVFASVITYTYKYIISQANTRRHTFCFRHPMDKPIPPVAGLAALGLTKADCISDMKNPSDPKLKACIIGYSFPKSIHPCGGTDKDKSGRRYDIAPLANGVRMAGCSCEYICYDPKSPPTKAALSKYDAIIVRINPGQISQGGGSQAEFDSLMTSTGKPVFSSPAVQMQLGSKNALTKIKDLKCGLPDTYTYYTRGGAGGLTGLEEGFKKCAAFQPRVIKQNRGSSGEGIWLVWRCKPQRLSDGSYIPYTDAEYTEVCPNLGDAVLGDDDVIKLMEMVDNHVEYHTVKEFIAYCEHGKDHPDAGEWISTGNAPYLDPASMIDMNGVSSGDGQLVDQRLLPRIVEGEVRMQMVGGKLYKIIHKKPDSGGMSAVGGIAKYTFFDPDDPNLPAEYVGLKKKFEQEIPAIMECMGLDGEPLPLWWTGDFIPMDDGKGGTDFVIGEFNCSCVGLSQFNDACGAGKDLTNVADSDLVEGYTLVKLIGEALVKAVAHTCRPPVAGPGETKTDCILGKENPSNPKLKNFPQTVPPRSRRWDARVGLLALTGLLMAALVWRKR